jgi:small subunit ribosomal protein S2
MEKTNETQAQESKKSVGLVMPSTQELLGVGLQFGHESQRWNPKMSKYIYTAKSKIHIIDIHQTEQKLKEAAEFIKEAASKGNVMFVGTKKQASEIIKNEAIRSGAYFISSRWAGGILTNFNIVKKSLTKLESLEKSFEEGVQDRTKYEVSVMKKEWERLNRLYEGIKTLSAKPTAIVIVDTRFEKAAVREARKLNIPVVALIDTNCDPDTADYIIPGNDDAIGAISLVLKTLADAVIAGNGGNGIKHKLVDYSKVEIKITRTESLTDSKELVEAPALDDSKSTPTTVSAKDVRKPINRKTKVKGMLEMAKEKASKTTEKKEVKKTSKTTKKPVAKKTTKTK